MSHHEDYIIEDDESDDSLEKPQDHNEQEVEESEDDEPINLLDKIDFSVPQVVVCVGKPKRGKSNAVKWFVLKNAVDNKIFKYGIVFSKTAKMNSDYSYVPQDYVYEDFNPLILQQFIDGISKLEDKPPCFCIVDDQQGLLNRNDPTLLNFISIHRHLNCSIFFNFQYLFGSMPTLRECTTIAVLFNSKGKRTIEGLFENFGQLFDKYDEFKNYFLALTSEKYVAMLYLQDEDNIEENYLWFKSPLMSKGKLKNLQLDF